MKKKTILVSISVVVTTVLLFLLISFFVLNYNVETNPDKYLKTKGTFSMDLEVFPKHISKKDVVKYLYHPKIGFLVDDNQYLYLKSKYNRKKFLSEKKRLRNIRNEFTHTKIDKNWLDKESYILYFNYGGINEFAVCDNNKLEIEYIYVQDPEFYDNEKYIDEIVNDKTYGNENNDFNTMPLGE